MVLNRKPKFDYSHLDWTFEVSSRTGPDDQGAYRQKLWLIAENTGAQTIQDIPMELHIRTDPPADAPISAWFAGKDFALNQKGRLKPLPVILTDPIQAGAKRRFQFEGTVTAKPPFTVIYEFKDESGKKLLARYAAEP
jgi:hypothetical protein